MHAKAISPEINQDAEYLLLSKILTTLKYKIKMYVNVHQDNF